MWVTTGGAILLAAAAALSCGTEAPPSATPDLVALIVVDTLRKDHLGAYGGTVPTPHLDALAARGQVFTNAFASFHQTTMSMGAIFTGLTPSIESDDPARPLPWNARTWCGMSRFQGDEPGDHCLPSGLPTLASSMRSAGYRTLAVVTNDLLFRPANYDAGFESWVEIADEAGRKRRIDAGEDPWHAASHQRAGPRVNQEVKRLLSEAPRGKVFLYVHYNDVHDYPIHGSYADAVQALDRSLGELFETLETSRWIEHARIVLTADHGEVLGGRHVIPPCCGGTGHWGNPSYAGVLEIPLIVSPATRRDPAAMIRGEDLLDLFAEIVPFDVDRSHPRVLAPDELYLSELGFQTYQRGRWKLIRRRSNGETALIDLVTDPGENRDASSDRPDVRVARQERIDFLARALAGAPREDRGLSDDEAARLESLGYLKR